MARGSGRITRTGVSVGEGYVERDGGGYRSETLAREGNWPRDTDGAREKHGRGVGRGVRGEGGRAGTEDSSDFAVNL